MSTKLDLRLVGRQPDNQSKNAVTARYIGNQRIITEEQDPDAIFESEGSDNADFQIESEGMDPSASKMGEKEVCLYHKIPWAGGGYIYVPFKEKSEDKCSCHKEDSQIKKAQTAALKAFQSISGHQTMKALNAKNISLNFSQGEIEYVVEGREDRVVSKNIHDLDSEIQEIFWNAIKELDFINGDELHKRTNRSHGGAQPLQINSAKWAQQHINIGADDYIAKHHHTFEASDATDGYRETALVKVGAAHLFIKKFRSELLSKREEIVTAKRKLDQVTQGAAIQRQEQLIQQIDTQLEKLDRLDTHAIFRSVPYAEDNLEGLTPEQQFERADLSRKEMEQHLYRSDRGPSKMGRFERWWKDVRWGDKRDASIAMIKAYSHDKGNLLVHDRIYARDRDAFAGEMPKHASMEEFVVFNILNLASNEFRPTEALHSLEITNNEDIKDIFTKALMDARAATLPAYQTGLNNSDKKEAFKKLIAL